jgi:predicted nucleic acid-binding protein
VILVDSSVWIDFFRGTANPQSKKLNLLLGSGQVLVGDLVLTEVLQGFQYDHEFKRALRIMTRLPGVELGGPQIAIRAAQRYRALRNLGITVRGTIDTIIATHCIESGNTLLYCDRDFDPFVSHLGLRSAMP